MQMSMIDPEEPVWWRTEMISCAVYPFRVRPTDLDGALIYALQTSQNIPSFFSRLVHYSSAVRLDSVSGIVNLLVVQFGRDHAFLALRRCHTLSFADWLECSLQEQSIHFRAYLATLQLTESVPLWIRREPYSDFIPADANEAERHAYMRTLRVMLTLLHYELGRPMHSESVLCGTGDWRVKEMLHQAEKTYGRINLKLTRLAKQMGVTEDHLGRLFRKHTSINFRDYLRRVRMANAGALLLELGRCTKAVAESLGYHDSVNFCHDFHEWFGITPKELHVLHSQSGNSKMGTIGFPQYFPGLDNCI